MSRPLHCTLYRRVMCLPSVVVQFLRLHDFISSGFTLYLERQFYSRQIFFESVKQDYLMPNVCHTINKFRQYLILVFSRLQLKCDGTR